MDLASTVRAWRMLTTWPEAGMQVGDADEAQEFIEPGEQEVADAASLLLGALEQQASPHRPWLNLVVEADRPCAFYVVAILLPMLWLALLLGKRAVRPPRSAQHPLHGRPPRDWRYTVARLP